MENPQLNTVDTMPEPSKPQNDLRLPLLALGLDLFPLFLGYLSSFGLEIPLFFLIVLLSPLMGLLTGIAALDKGKQHIGTFGQAIATLAIALPVAIVVLIFLFLVGAYTGLISLM